MTLPVLLMLGSLSAATAQPLPVPASFENDGDNPFQAVGAVMTRVEEHATHGRYALRIDIKGAVEDTWPGILIRSPAPADWTALEQVRLDAYLPGDQPLDLSYRLDSEGRGGAFGHVTLRPGENRDVSIKPADLAATADLTKVTGLLLYVRMPRRDRSFVIDNLRWIGTSVPDPDLIASFESDDDQPLKAGGGAVIERVEEYATDGRFSLRVDIPGSEKDTWPGIFLMGGDDPDWTAHETVEFDIFLAGDQPVGISTRFDTLDGENRFGSGPALRPGWNRGWGINLMAMRAELDMSRVKSLLLYVRMPRRDCRFYIDRVRWGTFAERFRLVRHIETLPPMTPSAEETRRGFIASTCSYLRAVFADSRPASRVDRLALFAARGEREPVVLNVHAVRDLPAVTIDVSDLQSSDGTIPAAAWEVGVIRYLDKRVTYSSDQYIAGMPSYVARLTAPVALVGGRTASFWLTLTTPSGARPGIYRGTVTVHAGDQRQAVPLILRVLPFELPAAIGLSYGEYYRKQTRAVDLRAQIRADLADMRAHGMTSVGLCFGVEETSYSVDGETVTFDFQGDTPFEWFMADYVKLGFPMPVILLADSGQAVATAGGKPGDPAYDRLYVNFHKALAAALAAKGWPELYVQPVDEPGWQDDSARERNVYLLKLLKEAGLKTEEDGPGDDYFHNQAGPYADIWNYNGGFGAPEIVARALDEGHLVTFYNNDVESYRPEVDRWAYGFFNWRQRMHGGYNWEYRGGSGDLYNNLDAQHGDWVHRYLPQGDEPGGPSTGWEGSREGVDDRRYLVLLEQLIERGRQAGGRAAQVAAEAAATLADTRARLDEHPRVRARARWTATLTPARAKELGLIGEATDATSFVTGDLKQPNGLTYEEYDTLRWLIATNAMRLAAALGEAPAWEPAFQPVEVGQRLAVIERGQSGRAIAPARPSVKVPRLGQAPTIDGVIDGDAGWDGAAEVALTLSDGSGTPNQPTAVKLGLHGGLFYAGFVCGEDKLDAIQAHITESGGPVWKDDCVEIFLDPGLTDKAFYQVVVNSLGTILRVGPGDSKWDVAVTASAKLDLDGKRWLAEVAIPIGGLRLVPRFGLNFGRERRPLEVLELSTWSVTGGPFGKPERFGRGVVEGDLPEAEPIEPTLTLTLSPQWLTTARTEVTATLTTLVPLERAAGASIRVRIEGGGRSVEGRIPGPLADRITASLAAGDLPPGDYQVTAVLEGVGREVVATARLTRISSPFDTD